MALVILYCFENCCWCTHCLENCCWWMETRERKKIRSLADVVKLAPNVNLMYNNCGSQLVLR